MSAAKDTGGPAFPTSFSKDYPTEIVGGMTLRDYFAAKALPAVIAHWARCLEKSGEELQLDDIDGSPAAISDECYVIADAMLAARSAP